jgi:hypothetical protein
VEVVDATVVVFRGPVVVVPAASAAQADNVVAITRVRAVNSQGLLLKSWVMDGHDTFAPRGK